LAGRRHFETGGFSLAAPIFTAARFFQKPTIQAFSPPQVDAGNADFLFLKHKPTWAVGQPRWNTFSRGF
jgi:hypothetical protein